MESGSRIGAYEIEGRLGAGGMGEVYRARDTGLDRSVALKMLPDEFADDSERLARFEQEARALAALNHPNIAQVYGLERADATVIAMELVEGEDLTACVERGPLQVDELLPLARQIAEALEAAHEAGIVHRDLKPANIRVRPDGVVKVLDFGLAKSGAAVAGAEGSADSPTIASPAVTGVGVIMGTAAYMAPEQARGKPVDRRADVWAFGCVLFEMLSGRRAFDGDDVSMTLASVLKHDLDWSLLPDSTPASLRRMIERCLETEPRRRYQSIGDARVEIENWIDEGFAPVDPSELVIRAGDAALARPGVTARVAAGVVLASLAAVVAWWAKPAPESPLRVLRLDAGSLAKVQGANDASEAQVLPDGSAVVVRAASEVWVHPMDGSEPRLLADGVNGFALSPDGAEVLIYTGHTHTRVALATGSSSLVSETGYYSSYGMHWSPSGPVLFSRGGRTGLRSLDPVTGVETQVLELGPSDTRFITPHALPNGDVMFSVRSRGRVEVFDGQTRHVVLDAADATVEEALYTRDGVLLWAQWGANEGTWSASYSLESRSLAGESHRISPVAGTLSVSDNGLLVITPRAARGNRTTQTILVDRSGDLVRELVGPQAVVRSLRISPDGRRLAMQQQLPGAGDMGVVVYDLERGTSVELRAGAAGGNPVWPEWLQDSAGIVFIAGPDEDRGLYMKDGPGSATRTLVSGGVENEQISVSADGRTVVYGGTDGNLWYVDTSGGDPVRFRDTEDEERLPSLSPDGRAIVFSRTSMVGTSGLFIERFPEGGGVLPLETTVWDSPRWSRDGTRSSTAPAAL